MLPMLKWASMNYFDSSRKNLTYFLKWTAVWEICLITKSANLHVIIVFFFINKYTEYS